MARRIPQKKEARFRQKASRRANASFKDDFALDVKQPRRQANRSFNREAASYRGAGALERDAISHAIKAAPKSLGPYRKEFKQDMRAQRGEIHRGVSAGISEARQVRNDELSDISATASALRSARSDEQHDIYQDLRSKQRAKQSKAIEARKKKAAARRERRRDKGKAQAENVRKHVRAAKEAVAEIRSQVSSAELAKINAAIKNEKKQKPALTEAERRAAAKAEKQALRQDPNRRKRLVEYLVTSQDTDKKAAEAAVARFITGPKKRKAVKGIARKVGKQFD